MASNFQDFIARNSVTASKPLPLVHTTAAYYVDSIRKVDALTPQLCDVFKSPLTYFFVGRPAYKVRESDGEAEKWELEERRQALNAPNEEPAEPRPMRLT